MDRGLGTVKYVTFRKCLFCMLGKRLSEVNVMKIFHFVVSGSCSFSEPLDCCNWCEET